MQRQITKDKIMKTTALLLLTIFGCLGTAQAQMIKKPLADKVENENQPTSIGENYTWVKGHWTWDNNDYAWIDGLYEETKVDHKWMDGEWERDRSTGAWFYSEGFWEAQRQGMDVTSNNISIGSNPTAKTVDEERDINNLDDNSSTAVKPTLGAMFK